MDLSQENIARYLNSFVQHPHPHLAVLEADAAARHVPIIGPWEGQLLALLARSIHAQQILELGTATGYSAIWFATATAAWDGHVTTIDQDPTRVNEARQNFISAGVSSRIEIVQGVALSALNALPGPFDFIFNDILYYFQNTEEAQQLLGACVQRLRPGGLLLCDNALRGGRVMDPSSDASVAGTKAFVEALLRDPQMDTSLIPIRDGVLVCRKHGAGDGAKPV
ncbi:MAG: O-methyltransferase [Candidatus Tectomicrobia bacterium]|nr:O-methyltransferase [Candidatus Tectomicrobia bacterium]